MVKFVVQLPSGQNKLVDVPPSASALELRTAAGCPGPSFTLAFNGTPLGDGASTSGYAELSTFGIIASAAPLAPPEARPAAECTICLEPLGSGAADAPVQALQCGHCFHAVCTQEWSRHSAYCPLCRRAMVAAGPAPGVAPTTTIIISSPATVKAGPPSPEDIAVYLMATRDALVRSPEWRLVVSAVRGIDAWSRSPAGQATIAYASAAAASAATLASRAAGHAALAIGNALTEAIMGPRAPPPVAAPPPVTIISSGGGAPVTVFTSQPAVALVACPTCRRTLQRPPGAPVFRCPCGNVLRA